MEGECHQPGRVGACSGVQCESVGRFDSVVCTYIVEGDVSSDFANH